MGQNLQMAPWWQSYKCWMPSTRPQQQGVEDSLPQWMGPQGRPRSPRENWQRTAGPTRHAHSSPRAFSCFSSGKILNETVLEEGDGLLATKTWYSWQVGLSATNLIWNVNLLVLENELTFEIWTDISKWKWKDFICKLFSKFLPLCIIYDIFEILLYLVFPAILSTLTWSGHHHWFLTTTTSPQMLPYRNIVATVNEPRHSHSHIE